MNPATLQVVPIIRWGGLLLAIFGLVRELGRVTPNTLTAVLLVVFFYCYGLLRGLTHVGVVYPLQLLLISITVVSCGAVFFSLGERINTQISVARAFLLFAAIWFIFLLVTGGFSLDFPPRFNFSLSEAGLFETSYSQGVTKFFGLTSVLSFWFFLTRDTFFQRILFFLITLSFLCLSFLGGARGDFLFVLAVYALLLWTGSLFRKVAAIGLLSASYFILVWAIEFFAEDFVVLGRLLSIYSGETLGQRDILVSQSMALLREQPVCLIFGCGFSHFQAFFGYEYGMYPHNVLFEAIITWGLPLVMSVTAFVCIGFTKMECKGPLFWGGIYMFLISLKSGDILSSWFAMSALYFWAAVGVSSLVPTKHMSVRPYLQQIQNQN